MLSTITISELWMYPIKSCRGISLARATVGPRGIIHDREWMIVEPDGMFLTQREYPQLAVVTPSFQDDRLRLATSGTAPIDVPLHAIGREMEVVVWRDHCQAIDQGDAVARWLGAFLGVECRLVRLADTGIRQVDPNYAWPDDRVGFADAFPLLLASESSLTELNRRMDQPLPMNRFRPNIVLRGALPFEEDRWRVIRANAMTLRVVKPCARCATTTVDQLRGSVAGPEPLTTLATFRKQNGKVLFAQNVIHDGPGILEVGARVEVLATKGE
jgi:uncharacterized protein